MSVIVVGPNSVRWPAGATDDVADWAGAALEHGDDEFALIDDQPVAVAALWRELFASYPATVLVCASWWSQRRVDAVADAARATVPEVAVVRRAAVLASAGASVVIEIAGPFVVLTLPPAVRPARVVSRSDEPSAVADEIARAVTGGPAVIDRPDGVEGAAELVALIGDRLRPRRVAVTVIDDERLLQLGESQARTTDESEPPHRRCAGATRPRHTLMLLAGGVAAACVFAVAVSGEDHAQQTTLLVEGRTVVQVPATWNARRVTAGPGSARVQVTSPVDPHVALHVAQSLVPDDETLARTAETLHRALLDEPPGVFVEFNPDNRFGDRPAVTYREIRDGHDILWTVLLDGRLRISIGCQSARGSEDAVRWACERAVASARDIGQLLFAEALIGG